MECVPAAFTTSLFDICALFVRCMTRTRVKAHVFFELEIGLVVDDCTQGFCLVACKEVKGER